jgi:hypothetical protein
MRRHRRYVLQRYLRQFGLPALAAMLSYAAVWAFLSFNPSMELPSSVSVWRPGSSGPSTSVSVWRGGGPFRNCAAARAAGAAPLCRGQPGYGSHLDADGDGIACEWSWRQCFW